MNNEQRDLNAIFAAKQLKASHPSDELVIDRDAFFELQTFRRSIVGDELDLVSDIIWSKTIPLKDFTVTLIGDCKNFRMRFCIFEEILNILDEVPEGRQAIIGAMQELDSPSRCFWLIVVTKGDDRLNISTEHCSEDGVIQGGELDVLENKAGFMMLWHSIQLALLHPKTMEILARPQKVKEYSREKDETGKRRRVVRYVRRHVINGQELHRSLREIKRNCLCWYVVGHWRHLKSGKITYVKGHWKGELRDLERNIDEGRLRELRLQDGNEETEAQNGPV